jgi:cytochrome bd-type quinol oxidase subunit 2
MTTTRSDRAAQADRVAAWATGIGLGAMVFMVTWLLGNRVSTKLFSVPTGPVVAMAAAVLGGIVVAVWQGRRLARRFPH